jgi:hypothetical protein
MSTQHLIRAIAMAQHNICQTMIELSTDMSDTDRERIVYYGMGKFEEQAQEAAKLEGDPGYEIATENGLPRFLGGDK